MPLKLPGARVGVIHLWLITLGPVLLFAAGVGLLAVGFWRHSEGVATIGALGVVASLLLPRLQGRFKFGPGGLEGDLDGEVLGEIIRQARELGLSAETTLDIAADAAGPVVAPGQSSRGRRFGSVGQAGLQGHGLQVMFDPDPVDPSNLARVVAGRAVERGALLEQMTKEIVERVAAERKWQVGREVRVEVPDDPDRHRRFDFALLTTKGPIFIETAILRTPEALVQKTSAIAEAVKDTEARVALVVVPEGDIYGHPDPGVEIVPVVLLEKRLREFL